MTARLLRHTALLLATAALLAAQPSKEVHRTLPLPANGVVSIDTYKGSVRVSVWDRNEVQVDVRIVEDGGWLAQDLRRADVDIDAGTNSVALRSDWNGAGLLRIGSTPAYHYTVRMPKQARLRVRDHKSDIAVEGVAGGIDLNTHKGTARLREIEGALLVDTHKGRVRAHFAHYNAGSRIVTHKGDIELQLPRDARFTLRQSLDRKAGLRSDFPMLSRASRGANVSTSAVNGGGPELSLRSHKGSFHLRERL